MRKLVLAVGVVALTVAGCSSEEPTEPVAEETGTVRAGSDLAAEAGSTEVEGAEPRLVVADADSGRIDVLDLATEESLHSFDVEDASRITTINGRYVVATDETKASVLDPGSWTIEHGDHSHSYIKDPVKIGTLDGDEPAHVIAGDRKVSVFFDGSGTADVIDFDSLSKGESTVATTIESAPHHGIAVPLSDHFVVSTGGTEEELPNGLELRDGSGELVRALEGTCPEMHGEAVFSNYFVVACEDGILKVDATADFATTKFPYPQNAERAWSVKHGSRGALVAAPTATGVLVLDTRSGQWVEARTADEAVASGMSSDGKTVLSLQTDGTFRTFDAVTGAELSSTPVLAGPVGEDDSPAIVVAGTRAYVSDPAANAVVEIDYRDGGRVARTFDFEYSPGSIGVVGA
ncbi:MULTISPECIES: hypothetical protein [unclassified Rhodococcus (in: high G+C Gram-positive bacteria)]|uniref:hypothetical protein n=1 Tax=unclassified Rhodococcus (in: high G+C Gram-positive bacteria) TaxID=192944 RepID=UPI0027DF807E|nr:MULTISPECIES: hypothetical protein [unclassified Rhodococcus (in: high G+C Gram-positive bacteria)]